MRRISFILPLLACWLAPLVAWAHPMGNFSINHYVAFRAIGNDLSILFRIDIAELPTVEEMHSLDANGDGNITDAEKAAYLARRGAEFTSGLSLRLNGQPIHLAVSQSDLQLRPGAAGLPILLISLKYLVPLDAASSRVRLQYADHNYPTRSGWREVIAVGGRGWDIAQSDVPDKDVSDGLLNYPTNLILAPPQVVTAHVEFMRDATTLGNDTSADVAVAPPSGGAPTPRDRFTQLITIPHRSDAFLLLALGIAFCLGCGHAMAPGHGKTVVAAYLVGSRGTAMHALLLGLVVTATHVAGVFRLGAVVLLLSTYIVPERLYPWMEFASGMTILVIGAQQFVLRSNARRGVASYDHDFVTGHTHALPERISLTNLVAMGVSGGMVPCPSALLVLLGAIAVGKTGLGMILIIAFSTGLAAVLVGLGLLAVHARQFLIRMEFKGPGILAGRLPLISSAAVTLLGFGIALQSLNTAGILTIHLPGQSVAATPR